MNALLQEFFHGWDITFPLAAGATVGAIANISHWHFSPLHDAWLAQARSFTIQDKASIPGLRQAGIKVHFKIKIFLLFFLCIFLESLPSFGDQVVDIGFAAPQAYHETGGNKAAAKDDAAEAGRSGAIINEKIEQAENAVAHDDVSLNEVIKRLDRQYKGLDVLGWMGLIIIIELGVLIISQWPIG